MKHLASYKVNSQTQVNTIKNLLNNHTGWRLTNKESIWSIEKRNLNNKVKPPQGNQYNFV